MLHSIEPEAESVHGTIVGLRRGKGLAKGLSPSWSAQKLKTNVWKVLDYPVGQLGPSD